MTTGVVTSVTPRRAGGALTATTAPTDTVLLVDDAADFDEEFTPGHYSYLVIGEETTPREYVGVQNDEEAQQSVTLIAPVGAVLEAGLPVVPWDPTSDAADKRAVEYQAWVRLDEGEKPIPATLPHTAIPVSGAFSLVGASVVIEETGPNQWKVADVLGREAALHDVDIIGARFLTAIDGRRVVITSSLPGFEGGAVLFYTNSAAEAEPGHVSVSETNLGGGDVILQAAMHGPRLDSATEAPRVVFSSTKLSGSPTTFVVINSDRFQINSGRITFDSANVAAEVTASPVGFAGPYFKRADGDTGIALGTARLNCINNAGGYVQIRASSFDVSSDADLKTDVTRVEGALSAVEAVESADFIRADTGEPGRGFLAQELREHVPAAVTPAADDDDSLGVDLYALVGTLWAALREETAARKALECRVATLEGGTTSRR